MSKELVVLGWCSVCAQPVGGIQPRAHPKGVELGYHTHRIHRLGVCIGSTTPMRRYTKEDERYAGRR